MSIWNYLWPYFRKNATFYPITPSLLPCCFHFLVTYIKWRHECRHNIQVLPLNKWCTNICISAHVRTSDFLCRVSFTRFNGRKRFFQRIFQDLMIFDDYMNFLRNIGPQGHPWTVHVWIRVRKYTDANCKLVFRHQWSQRPTLAAFVEKKKKLRDMIPLPTMSDAGNEFKRSGICVVVKETRKRVILTSNSNWELMILIGGMATRHAHRIVIFNRITISFHKNRCHVLKLSRRAVYPDTGAALTCFMIDWNQCQFRAFVLV